MKAGAVLPLARPTLHTDDPDSWKLTALVYGDGSRAAQLFEDDGAFAPQLTETLLEWDAVAQTGRVDRRANAATARYTVGEWKNIP